MRFQFLTALACLGSLAAAQYQGLPKCAQACVGNSLVDYGCGNIQAECICKNKPLIDALACCVGKSCTAASDVADTQTFAAAICKPYDVTLPASATCASTSSGSASPTSAAASSSPSSASATGALATGGAGSGSGNSTGNAAGTGAAGSASPSSPSATPSSTNGAPIQTMAAGLGAAAMGLLVML